LKNVLLTGFGPFREHSVNPSQSVVERLNGKKIGGAKITGLTLPVSFGMDTELAFVAIDALKPCLVLSLGLNAGIDGLDLEMFAINHRYGATDQDLIPIIPDGPAAYFASIDIETIVKAAPGTKAPIRKHSYAGSFLCNHIFYQTLHYTASKQSNTKVGFVHIPLSTEQLVADKSNTLPSLPLDVITDGIRFVIETVLE